MHKMALSLYNDLFSDFAFTPLIYPQSPRMDLDVVNRGDHVEVVANVPGFSPEDIQVECVNGYLSIKAERKSQVEKQDDTRYYRRERHHCTVSRSVKLPRNVDEASIRARLDKGVLTVALPLQVHAGAQSRRIQVDAV